MRGRWCSVCGRDKQEDHMRLVPGGPRVCMLEFTTLNTTTGLRREADPSREALGVQRTDRNGSMWVHVSNLSEGRR